MRERERDRERGRERDKVMFAWILYLKAQLIKLANIDVFVCFTRNYRYHVLVVNVNFHTK